MDTPPPSRPGVGVFKHLMGHTVNLSGRSQYDFHHPCYSNSKFQYNYIPAVWARDVIGRLYPWHMSYEVTIGLSHLIYGPQLGYKGHGVSHFRKRVGHCVPVVGFILMPSSLSPPRVDPI